MTTSFDEALFDSLILRLNKCIRESIERGYNEDERELLADEMKDFRGCCTKKEQHILRKAIVTAIENNPGVDKTAVYLAVLYFYYYTIVLEYYMTDMCGVREFVAKINYPNQELERVKNLVKEKAIIIENLVMKITTSDEEWCSYIRRVLNSWDRLSSFSGGRKKKRTVKRKRNKSKSKKLKRKTRRN